MIAMCVSKKELSLDDFIEYLICIAMQMHLRLSRRSLAPSTKRKLTAGKL